MKYRIYIKITSFIFTAVLLLAFSSRMIQAYGLPDDGGIAEAEVEICDCSGGALYDVLGNVVASKPKLNIYAYFAPKRAYADTEEQGYQSHTYMYSWYGETQEYSNYSLAEDDLPAYFLTNLDPYGECLIIVGEYCEDASEEGYIVEGVFSQLGDSTGVGTSY